LKKIHRLLVPAVAAAVVDVVEGAVVGDSKTPVALTFVVVAHSGPFFLEEEARHIPAKVEEGYRSIAQVVARLVVVLVHSVAGLEGKSLVDPFLDGLEEVGIDREVEGTEVEVDLQILVDSRTKVPQLRMIVTPPLPNKPIYQHASSNHSLAIF